MTALTGAERTQRWAERRRAGLRSIRVEITEADVEFLLKRRLLHPAQVENREAIGRALGRLLDALQGR